jgi:exosortase/archaeosortase family protein
MKNYLDIISRLFVAMLFVLAKPLYGPSIVNISAYLSYIPLKISLGAAISENIITLGLKSIAYVEACAAIGAYMFLGLLILFTRGIAWKLRLKLFGWGSLFILVANIIRIDLLALILVNNGADLFVTLHLFTWKILSGIYVALVWIFLVKKYDIREIPVVGDFKFLKKKLFEK